MAIIEFDQHGELMGGFGTVQDVTERVEFERQGEALFKREHHIARVLQESIMPAAMPVEMMGCCIAARYRPALDEAQIGGDFYDIFELGDGKF